MRVPRSAAPAAPPAGSAPPDPLVHDLYARALQGLEQPSREPIEQAHAYLVEALAQAPDYAPAWAALADYGPAWLIPDLVPAALSPADKS